MKKFILMLVLVLTFTSCQAQHPPLPKGHTIGYVVEVTEKGSVINANGKSMIVTGEKNLLEANVEYDLVYTVIERRGKTLVVELIHAEHSAAENARRRSKLLLLLK